MKLIRLLFLIIVSSTILNCSNSKESPDQSNLKDIPEEIKALENLKVFEFENGASEKIEFTKQDTFGETYRQLLSPTRGFGPSIAVDNNGRVFRVDGGKKFVEVYDKNGEKIKEIGREGRGPGEFLRVDAIYIFSGKIFLYDSTLIRLSIFSLQDFKLLEIINFETQMYAGIENIKAPLPGTVIPFTENSLLIALLLETERRSYGYYLLNYEGNFITKDMILQTDSFKWHNGKHNNGGSVGISLPFSSKGLMAVSDSKIYTTNSKEIAIQVLNSDGKNELTFYYPFKNDPLEEQEVLDTFHPNLHSVIKSAEYPKIWPALDNLLVDDMGRMWIAKIVDDKTIHEWSVLESNGELKASFEWPADQPIKIIKNGKMYVEESNKETRAQLLVSYGYQFTDF